MIHHSELPQGQKAERALTVLNDCSLHQEQHRWIKAALQRPEQQHTNYLQVPIETSAKDAETGTFVCLTSLFPSY